MSNRPQTQVTIIPLAASDISEVQRCASDELVQRTTNLPSPYPADGAASWFARVEANRSSGSQQVFAVRADGVFVGVMSLNGVDAQGRTAHLDYWIASPAWGRGFATAAARLVVAFAKDQLGLSRVFSGCLVDNHGSRRVLEKCGFVRTGIIDYAGPFPGRYGGRKMYAYERTL